MMREKQFKTQADVDRAFKNGYGQGEFEILQTVDQGVVEKSIARLPLTLEALCRHEESVESFLLCNPAGLSSILATRLSARRNLRCFCSLTKITEPLFRAALFAGGMLLCTSFCSFSYATQHGPCAWVSENGIGNRQAGNN